MPNVNGPHPLTQSSKLFRHPVTNIFHRYTLDSDVRESVFIHSGMFIINYAMQLIRIFCSSQPKNILLATRTMCLRTQPVTLINSPFVTFGPVNSAQIEIWSRTFQNLATNPSQVWPPQKVVLCIADAFLECMLMVEFTDNEGDEPL
jgi:hypothetical protein